MIPVSDPGLEYLDRLPPLREVISAHNLRAEKSLGQNFLLDGNITDKIVSFIDANMTPNMTVFEIGPGPGGLTRSLLRSKAKQIIALEYDARAIAALQDLQAQSGGRLRVLHQDALEGDITELAPGPRGIVANLPYNIASPLLIGWLRIIAGNKDDINVMGLMFQKEVADRITAKPGTKAYGRLSVITQWLCAVQKVYDLPPSAFTPPPKVSSSIVRFVPKSLSGDQPSFASVERITAMAFNQRRKMIRASLKPFITAIESLGLDPMARAENLEVADFIALAQYLEKMQASAGTQSPG
ncbi:MAG: 16S rRNA (adenine(1518)-N(6)/adenine(1519)-N(6))-dimethyltransferase [Micavibrio sp.]|mgnify:CR=1 FL=1|nr:16S rRNA (adenine(1518)-N(6)/adenine(1519)-N(6))-dimethyltransferase [Micavibrio sp.]